MAHKSPKLCVVHLRFIFHRLSPSTGPSKYSSDAPSTLTLHRYAVDQFEIEQIRSSIRLVDRTLQAVKLQYHLDGCQKFCQIHYAVPIVEPCFQRCRVLSRLAAGRSCIKFLTFCESNIKLVRFKKNSFDYRFKN